jgi:hypothetical protein
MGTGYWCHRMRTHNAAALVGTAMLPVLLFPLGALTLCHRGQRRSPVPGPPEARQTRHRLE